MLRQVILELGARSPAYTTFLLEGQKSCLSVMDGRNKVSILVHLIPIELSLAPDG